MIITIHNKEITDEDLIIGENITVDMTKRGNIRGKFIGWQLKPPEYDGRFILIEQVYENYILSIADLLDSEIISLDEFHEQIKPEHHELKKVRKIDERHIYKINWRRYKIT